MKDSDFTKILSDRSEQLAKELRNLKIQKQEVRDLLNQVAADIRKREKDLKAIDQLLSKGERNVRSGSDKNPQSGGPSKTS